ncbi:MAG: hypothetical protein EBW42_04725, partial [Rhodobacterales bacterium]|nr:hypothetical protein [Rhodobacterales bacterium]
MDTLRIAVKKNSSSSVGVKYSKQDNLFNERSGYTIDENSTVYFVQEIEDEQYEIVFGDGVFGKA